MVFSIPLVSFSKSAATNFPAHIMVFVLPRAAVRSMECGKLWKHLKWKLPDYPFHASLKSWNLSREKSWKFWNLLQLHIINNFRQFYLVFFLWLVWTYRHLLFVLLLQINENWVKKKIQKPGLSTWHTYLYVCFLKHIINHRNVKKNHRKHHAISWNLILRLACVKKVSIHIHSVWRRQPPKCYLKLMLWRYVNLSSMSQLPVYS